MDKIPPEMKLISPTLVFNDQYFIYRNSSTQQQLIAST
jgi:hypothetical protein